MFATDLTINGKTYSLKTQRMGSSVRSVASRDVSSPLTLSVSHESANNGRVSSAVQITDTSVINTGSSIIKDDIKVLVKVQYNPISGRTGIEDAITSALADAIAFFETPGNTDKILNQES